MRLGKRRGGLLRRRVCRMPAADLLWLVPAKCNHTARDRVHLLYLMSPSSSHWRRGAHLGTSPALDGLRISRSSSVYFANLRLAFSIFSPLLRVATSSTSPCCDLDPPANSCDNLLLPPALSHCAPSCSSATAVPPTSSPAETCTR